MATCEVEEGEILSEEEAVDAKETIQTNPLSKPFEAYNVVERPNHTQTSGSNGYRTSNRDIVYSSDEGHISEESSDEDSPVAKKHSRQGNIQNTGSFGGRHKQDSTWVGRAHQNIVQSKGKKPNNIWGSVLEEEKMTKFVNQLNRNENISYEERGAESYDYTRSISDPRFNKEHESSDSDSSSEEEEEQGPADLTEKETFGFIPEKPKNVRSKTESHSSSEENSDIADKDRNSNRTDSNGRSRGKKRWTKQMKRNRKRENSMEVDAEKSENVERQNIKEKQQSNKGKQSSQERPNRKRGRNEGKQSERSGFKPHPSRRQRPDQVKDIKPMKHVQITDGMEDIELVDTIIDALRETQEQTDIFLRILDQLGREKMVKLFKATEDIEDMGGLMIQDGSRRRTPGGVFLYLVRTDCDVTSEQRNVIFAEQRAEYKAQCRQWKKEKKKWLRKKIAEEKKQLKEQLEGKGENSMDTETNAVETTRKERYENEEDMMDTKQKDVQHTEEKAAGKSGSRDTGKRSVEMDEKGLNEEDKFENHGELEEEELVDIQLE